MLKANNNAGCITKTVKGNYKVRIRVTYLKESKYYDTGLELTKASFERITSTKR